MVIISRIENAKVWRSHNDSDKNGCYVKNEDRNKGWNNEESFAYSKTHQI